MTHSALCSRVMPASPYNYSKGRAGHSIGKITPHHAAGILDGTDIAAIFQKPTRGASANYCIGVNGDIVCSVEEENRSWCSSNAANDNVAITIECTNCSVAPNWGISNATYKSLVALCVDICRRRGFRLNWTGGADGTLTMHKMFWPTACPGPTLESLMPKLAADVNAELDGGTQPSPTPATGLHARFQAYDRTHGWLGEVDDYFDGTTDDYAGWIGYPVTGLRAKTPGLQSEVGNLEYRMHVKNGDWFGWRRDYEKDNVGDTFAGDLKQQLDGLQMRLVNCPGHTVKYCVHTLEDGWLPWVTGYGNGDANITADEYAGIWGHTIDAVKVDVI